MTSNEILKADILDILFDNRNKQYGAYTLRKNYSYRLGVALGLSLSSVLLVFFLMRIDHSGRHSDLPAEKGAVIVTNVDMPPAIKKPKPHIPKKLDPPPQVRTEKLTTIAIKDDKLVSTTVPDQRLLTASAISNVKLDGIAPTDIVSVKQQPNGIAVKEEVEKQPDYSAPVQREPEFPGGVDAWLNFLQKNLIAPSELEAGDKKMVSIRFQVSPEGLVTNFEIVQSAGKVFDNEVIRVLKKMPKWKPAIQNGQPVARAFTQPVTFVGIEQ
jgi:protein TonB